MKNWRIWIIFTVIVMAGALAYLRLPALNSTQSYEGTELSKPAPDFRLTDQNGSVTNLSDFRKKVVVLTFTDAKCVDTCPVTAAHFRLAYEQLNHNEANEVVFLGVNVNAEANAIADVLETTQAWHMDEILSWHFLTGSHGALEPVWNAYGVAAIHSHDTNSIVHTPGTFLIDQLGKQRWYISIPFDQGDNTLPQAPLNELLVKHIRELLSE